MSTTHQTCRLGDLKSDSWVWELKATAQTVGGLLHNLVAAILDGYYEVCAGGRRLIAIALLIEDGSIPDEYAVPCLVMPA